MWLERRLRTLLACAFLEVGAMAGVPMRPEQIRDLMHAMNVPTLAHVIPTEDDEGDRPPGTKGRKW